MRRYPLSKKAKKRLIESLRGSQKLAIVKDERIEIIVLNKTISLYLINGMPWLLEFLIKTNKKTRNMYLPYLGIFYNKSFTQEHKQLYEYFLENYTGVIVDRGAVKHILNGADIMIPGIISVEGEIDALKEAIIFDENKHAIATGYFLMTKKEYEDSIIKRRGRAVKNMHYLGDNIWALVEKTL